MIFICAQIVMSGVIGDAVQYFVHQRGAFMQGRLISSDFECEFIVVDFAAQFAAIDLSILYHKCAIWIAADENLFGNCSHRLLPLFAKKPHQRAELGYVTLRYSDRFSLTDVAT